MATTKDIIDDSELAKSYITSSNMSDDYKRTYLKLINITTMATNGISPEEKIQKMTEAIQLLAVTQGMFMSNIDQKINEAVASANRVQCVECKAMKHAIQVEQKEKDQEIIERYKEQMGIKNDENVESKSWNEVLKIMLTKPYIYIVGSILIFSPYGVEILKTILNFCSK